MRDICSCIKILTFIFWFYLIIVVCFFLDSMGCTSAKSSKIEGEIDRYHEDIFNAVQAGNTKQLREILDELDRRKASATKKEVLNMGM